MSVQDPEPRTPARAAERVVEGALLALIVVIAGVIGLPSLVDALRDGSVRLDAVFYPVLLVAAVTLAWTRRA